MRTIAFKIIKEIPPDLPVDSQQKLTAGELLAYVENLIQS